MCYIYTIDTYRHTYVHTCMYGYVYQKSKNEAKILWLKGKGKLEVCSLIGMPFRRTKETLSGGKYILSWTHSHMHMSSDMQMPQGKGWSLPSLFFAFSYLSIQTLMPSHCGPRVWSPFPREAITIGHCSVGRPQVKGLPLLGAVGTSEHW